MKKAVVERSAIVFLFILTLVVFSFAERDTKKAFSQFPKSETLTQTQSSPSGPISEVPVSSDRQKTRN